MRLIVGRRQHGHACQRQREQHFQLLGYMTTPAGATVLTWRWYGDNGHVWNAAEIARMCAPHNGVFECEYSALWNRVAPRH